MSETETNNRASLYRKIAAVTGAIDPVGKDGRNKDQKYSYATPAAVFTEIKPLLAAQKLAIVPFLIESSERDTGRKSSGGNPYLITKVRMQYRILDGDTGESLDVTWEAQAGTYGDDKGVAKAQTIALRTFLIQLFQIPAVDEELDPDAASPRPLQQKPQRHSTNGASYRPAPAPTEGAWRPRFESMLIDLYTEEVKLAISLANDLNCDEAIFLAQQKRDKEQHNIRTMSREAALALYEATQRRVEEMRAKLARPGQESSPKTPRAAA